MPGRVLVAPGAVLVSSKGRRRNWALWAPLYLLLEAVALSLLILKFAPAPFFWALVNWAGVFFASMFCVRGDWSRAILLNLGIVACLLAATEAYYLRAESYVPPTVSRGFVIDDDILGWAPAKNNKGHAVELGSPGLFHKASGLIFDATYTIGPDGLRKSPPYRKNDLADSVLFFGCSYAFGSGLNDEETLPYQVGVQSEGHYRTFNFAFEGYSPAQMLAGIESGSVRNIVDTHPHYAYYIAIPHHVWRVAGRVAWIHREPRYVLDSDGTLRRAGYLPDRVPLAERLGLGARLAAQLGKSATWRRFTLPDSDISDEDIRLYLAMVRRSRDLLTSEYAGLQFRVILWPGHTPLQDSTYQKMRIGFTQMGVPVDLVEDILPGYKNDKERFTLSSSDTHPNALADRLLARYVLEEIGHNR